MSENEGVLATFVFISITYSITYLIVGSIGLARFVSDVTCDIGDVFSGEKAFVGLCAIMIVAAILTPCVAICAATDKETGCPAFILMFTKVVLGLSIAFLVLLDKFDHWCIPNRKLIYDVSLAAIIVCAVIIGSAIISCMACVGMFTCLVCCERETRVERMV